MSSLPRPATTTPSPSSPILLSSMHFTNCVLPPFWPFLGFLAFPFCGFISTNGCLLSSLLGLRMVTPTIPPPRPSHTSEPLSSSTTLSQAVSSPSIMMPALTTTPSLSQWWPIPSSITSPTTATFKASDKLLKSLPLLLPPPSTGTTLNMKFSSMLAFRHFLETSPATILSYGSKNDSNFTITFRGMPSQPNCLALLISSNSTSTLGLSHMASPVSTL
mmetsp:Transcript_25406/g.47746  ORF Transcript_25406/g.47746 Transcript_25406/m.47746 type:complete len:218 (+) Transcript_25406:256-909(+)